MRYAQEYIQLVVISLELRCQYVESIHEDFNRGLMIGNVLL